MRKDTTNAAVKRADAAPKPTERSKPTRPKDPSMAKGAKSAVERAQGPRGASKPPAMPAAKKRVR